MKNPSLYLLCILTASLVSESAQASAPDAPLRLSIFKDITAFVLDQMKTQGNANIEVKYVKNATEAHADLKEQKADLVFMSYDDTLSIALEEHHADIVAVMPIHGGILDLCGTIDVENNKTLIGIDTDSGYARALKQYLKKSYPPADYKKLRMTYAGATNLRFDSLVNGSINATLLNPPYSYRQGVHRIDRLQDSFGGYQGVVANTNKTWLTDPDNLKRLRQFSESYYETVWLIRNNRDASIQKIMSFYSISLAEATETFDRLWETDGLAMSGNFNEHALKITQEIFTRDTGIPVVPDQHFTILVESPGS